MLWLYFTILTIIFIVIKENLFFFDVLKNICCKRLDSTVRYMF